ncbi:MAG TPA: preprotein translocase subunit SecE [Flavobacteriales bacterium]|nr:preprotein translocase subunit SecE [Flavobacteriales bacterium]HRJ39457.1 preprotein translocase subunit SecE [Flavobacteriales bacterium]
MAGIRAYFEETVNELVNKVSWPTQKELQSSAIIVLVASVIFALVVFLMDFIFGIRSAGPEGGFVWKGILGYFYDIFK